MPDAVTIPLSVRSRTGRHSVAVCRGRWIRIYGADVRLVPATANRGCGPALRSYDQTYAVGDEAIYGGRNLHYIGRIVRITDRTVSVYMEPERRNRRLLLSEFSEWNRFRPVELARQRNYEWID